MSASNVLNNYNKLLLQENFYNIKFNPSKRKNKKEVIISLVNAITNNDNNYQIKENPNDSLSTIDAMNNPYMLKFSEEDKLPYDLYNQNDKNNKRKILSQRKKAQRKRPNSKAINIQRYSDCVKFSENNNNKIKNKNKYMYLSPNYKTKKKLRNFIIDSARQRPLSFKKNCNCCNNILEFEKALHSHKFDKLIDNDNNHFNIYNNKNFKDSLSCFMYHINNINNFASKEAEIRKGNLSENKCKINYNTNMESDYTKNLKKIRFREIHRIQFDPSNFYYIQKPLIPTIRGKILKNMKKRYIRPIRNVVTSKDNSTSYRKIKIN